MKIFSLPLAAACLLASSIAMPASEQKPLPALAEEQFAFAREQYAGLLKEIEAEKVKNPRTLENGAVKMARPQDWTSGFFPGGLWLVYEHTGDAAFKAAAEDYTRRLESLRHFTGHHDIGFMLYCSYGQGYRLTKNPEYRAVLIDGAKSLATRFNPKPGVIRSWDWGEWKFPVIIDNMMNLELLVFGARESGEKTLQDVATSHADKTLVNHFRPDGSSVHLVDYDPQTGAVLKKQTWQGATDASAWARGQAWGLYGYTRMAALTGAPAYLNHARKIADFIAAHPRLPEDGIPYWDFDAPDIPQAKRDSSAGAIMASALLELATLTRGEESARYRSLAERQLRSLCSPAYRAKLHENGHFLLMHAVGHFRAGSEVDVPLIYGDYYFLEALGRVAQEKR
jgi:unsaturated chondroitin disaccharide hydrolase